MSEKQKILIFAKDGKDIKWGIEFWDHCWKCKRVLHKGVEIAELLFGVFQQDSLKEGYTVREIEIDKDSLVCLLPEEQFEKDLWDKEASAIKAKKELREKYQEEFEHWYLMRQAKENEKLFEEFLKTKEPTSNNN